MRRTMLILILLTVTFIVPVAAQQAAADSAPTRVRIRRTGVKAWLIGAMRRVSSESLYVESGGGTFAVARGDVTRFEVSRGMHSDAGRGFGIGLAAGAALGLITGIAYVSSPEACWCDPSPGLVAGVTAMVALPSAVLGAGIGALSHSERWRASRLPARPLSLEVMPRQGRMAVGVAMTF